MSTDIKERVDNLESVLQRFIVNTEKSIASLAEDRNKDRAYFNELFEKHAEQNRLALEKYREENRIILEKYTDENRIFLEKYKDENRITLEKYTDENRIILEKYKDENRIALEKYKEENKAEFEKYKEENRLALEKYKEENKLAFQKYKQENKTEFEKYKEENRKDLKRYKQEMNQQWGDLANKMGSLIEDIFMPGVGPSVKRYFNSEISFIGTHIKKYIKKLDLKGEFDVVATDEKRVFVVDVKSSIDKQKIDEFKKDVLPRFRKLFPEYASKTLIPIMGRLRFDDDIISYASKNGIYVMAYREWEYLDILNFDEVKPQK